MSASAQGDAPVVPGLPSLRRPAFTALFLAGAGLVASVYFDRLLFGALFALGLGLGLLNVWFAHGAVARASVQAIATKQAMALSSLSRLLVITAVALVIGFLLRPDGVGIFVGLAVFQVVLVVLTTVPVMRGLRQHD